MTMVVLTTGARRAMFQLVTKPTPRFLQAGCPSSRPTNSVKALKGNILPLSIRALGEKRQLRLHSLKCAA